MYKEVPYYAQFLVNEYAKALHRTSIIRDNISNLSVSNCFELNWLQNL